MCILAQMDSGKGQVVAWLRFDGFSLYNPKMGEAQRPPSGSIFPAIKTGKGETEKRNVQR